MFLASAASIRASPAGRPQPRHADPFANRKTTYTRSERSHATNNLVAGNDRQFRIWQLAVDHRQLGGAHAGHGNRPRLHDKRRARRTKRHGMHACHHSSFQFRVGHSRSKIMRTDTAQPIHLKDYRPPDWLVETVSLDFSLHPTKTKVCATLKLKPNPDEAPAPLG